jgi:hypothetical protein
MTSLWSMPCQVDRGHAQVGVTELALDHVQRHPFASHLDRVGVTQLMRRNPPPNARTRSELAKGRARSRLRPRPPGGWTVDHAHERADRKRGAVF